MDLRRSLLPLTFLLVTGCAQEVSEPSGSSSDEIRGDVTAEGTVLIAFDGTGNHLAQNNVIAQMFNSVATTGGEPEMHSFKESARLRGAEGKAPWAYASYASRDSLGRTRALYFNGPPEGASNLAFADSGARFIVDEALIDGPLSPVCKAVTEPATKKVFLIGYSRGAVLAHLAATRIMNGSCGYGMGAKVTWLGLVDPVEVGSPDGYAAIEDCDATAARYSVFDNARTQGCLGLVRSSSTGQPVPVSVLMKTTEANAAADPFLLSTTPVNGASYRVFDFEGTAISVHLDMGRSGIVRKALEAEGAARGGLRYR